MWRGSYLAVAHVKRHSNYTSTLARSRYKGGQVDPQLRALREHILIVRPQRARRTVWLLPSLPPPLTSPPRCATNPSYKWLGFSVSAI